MRTPCLGRISSTWAIPRCTSSGRLFCNILGKEISCQIWRPFRNTDSLDLVGHTRLLVERANLKESSALWIRYEYYSCLTWGWKVQRWIISRPYYRCTLFSLVPQEWSLFCLFQAVWSSQLSPRHTRLHSLPFCIFLLRGLSESVIVTSLASSCDPGHSPSWHRLTFSRWRQVFSHRPSKLGTSSSWFSVLIWFDLLLIRLFSAVYDHFQHTLSSSGPTDVK